MYFVINLIGVLVFLAVGVLLSKKRKDIHWRGVGSLLALNVFIAWFLTSFPIGRDIVQGAAAGFTWLVSVAYEGIAFAFPDWVHVPQMNFFTSALLPILLVVPLFDILTYIGLLPFVISKIKNFSRKTKTPKEARSKYKIDSVGVCICTKYRPDLTLFRANKSVKISRHKRNIFCFMSIRKTCLTYQFHH